MRPPDGVTVPVHDGTVVLFTATLGRVEPERVETRGGFAFADFIKQADDVETRLQNVLAADLRRFQWTERSLIAVCLLLSSRCLREAQ